MARDVFAQLGRRLRDVIEQEVGAGGGLPERFRVIDASPLTIVSVKDSSLVLEEGDEDFDIADALDAEPPSVGDHVLVVRDEDDDYVAVAAVRRGNDDEAPSRVVYATLAALDALEGRVTSAEGAVDVLEAPPLLTALPGTGLVDDREIRFQTAGMSAQSVAWLLKYRAAIGDAFKWVALGNGPALVDHKAAGDVSKTVATAFTFTAFADSPSLVVPVSGYYDIEYSAVAQMINASSTDMRIRPYVGAVGIGPSDAPLGALQAQFAAQTLRYVWRAFFSAGDTIVLRYTHSVTTAQVTYLNKLLRLTPVRVG